MPYRYAVNPDASTDTPLKDAKLINGYRLAGRDLAIRIAVTKPPVSRDPDRDGAYKYDDPSPLREHFARPMVRVGKAWVKMDGTEGSPRLEGPISSWPGQLAALGYVHEDGWVGYLPPED